MKPSIPKGTRDFIPSEVYKRKYIFSTIEEVYKKYGYQPIETPAMELLQTLTGKYGEEGDKLLFKVLNNGDYLAKANKEALNNLDSNALISSISKRGLRYDLTVPFARFVVMRQNDLTFPFKRYQIQPVWRADRPQKGRYQEFWQCDADVVGSDSLMYEAELIQILSEVFSSLNIKVRIKINNRKILYGIAEAFGIESRFMDMTIAIDKLDKIGKDGVVAEMTKREISEEAAIEIIDLIQAADLTRLVEVFEASDTGIKGIEETREIMTFLRGHEALDLLDIDMTLARGLNYYTGTILEVVADNEAYPDLVMGSLSGGGRYDNLTEVFGMKGNSGVGVSFGADRIYDVMDSLNLYPEEVAQELDILLVAFDKESHQYAFRVLGQLRSEGIRADLYPDPVKMKKQMKYAHARNVPYVGIIGSDEMNSGTVALKDMESGAQNKISVEEVINTIKK
ncbi:MAG: histidine--tRNA ligase [Saprospiraceae bacterium]|nr:histidine--tRNA ligase [Saprospiraceae bacterium]